MKRALAFAVFALATPCHAEVYEFVFGGPIIQVQGAPPAPWSVVTESDSFSVRARFDSLAPDAFPGLDGYASYAAEIADVTVAGVSQTNLSANFIIHTTAPAFYEIFFFLPGVGEGSIYLGTQADTALNTDTLPLDLSLSPYDIREFSLVFPSEGPPHDPNNIYGEITAFSSQVIPAPAGICLFALALTARRRRD